MNGQYKIGDIVLQNWTLVRLIGEGSYGKVFEPRRKDFGGEDSAAVKIIVIPQTREEINEAMSEGMTEESVSEYFRSFVEEIAKGSPSPSSFTPASPALDSLSQKARR